MKDHFTRLLFVILFVSLSFTMYAATITGKITEAGTNDVLPGANVTIEGLREALERDDPFILQGKSVDTDYFLHQTRGTCVITYCCMIEHNVVNPLDLLNLFYRVINTVDSARGDRIATMLFSHWYDVAPRDIMRKSILQNIEKKYATAIT